eukprot:scaffold12984_cov58-Attheya_sp.AAC.5
MNGDCKKLVHLRNSKPSPVWDKHDRSCRFCTGIGFVIPIKCFAFPHYFLHRHGDKKRSERAIIILSSRQLNKKCKHTCVAPTMGCGSVCDFINALHQDQNNHNDTTGTGASQRNIITSSASRRARLGYGSGHGATMLTYQISMGCGPTPKRRAADFSR